MAATIEVAKLFVPLVTDATKFIKGLTGAARQARDFSSDVQRSTQQAGASFKNIAAGVAVGNAAFMVFNKTVNMAISTVQRLTSVVLGFSKAGLGMAGRMQEMEFAALATGRAMGLQEDQIRGAIDQINDLGIRYDAAAKTVAQFARNQVDMSKATDLVRIAQGAAIMMQEDSSETMSRLVWAVTTHSTVMLRRMGIMTDLTAAEDKFAASLGKTREELTNAQLVQADVNAVIAAGAPLLGIYAAAMQSPTKQLRSLTQRELPELGAALGAPFLDAWAIAIKAIRDFVGAVIDAVREGGTLYPIFIQMGAGLSVLADQFAAALGWVTNFVTGLDQDLSQGMARTAENMLSWGANLVASLAEGIISAASTVLVGALNFIGSILATWLGPGSPPRVAPDIGKWGTQAIAEWLHGFTQADFSILDKIQAPLRQVLEGAAFTSISEDMIKAIAETGAVGEDIFNRITEAAGGYGQEIVNLIRLQTDLVGATEELEGAEELVKQRQQELINVQDEYYRLRAKRAPVDVLKAKQEEVDAAQEALTLAEDQSKEARDHLKSLESQAALQDLLVKQLVKLGGIAGLPGATAVTTAAAATARATAKAPKMPKMPKLKPIKPEFIMPEPAAFDIASRISQAIDDAKAVMEEKMAGIFKPLIDAWQSLKEGPLAELSEAFEENWPTILDAARTIWEETWPGIWDEATRVWDEFLTGFTQGVDEANDKFVESSEAADTWIGKLGVTFGKESTKFIDDFWKAWDTGVVDFNADMDNIAAKAPEWKEDLEGIWESIQKIFGLGREKEKPSEKVEELGGAFGELGKIVDIITKGLDGWNQALAIVVESKLPIGEFTDLGNIIGAMALPTWLRHESPTPFEESLHAIAATVTEELQPSFDTFLLALTEQWTAFADLLTVKSWPLIKSEWLSLMVAMEQRFNAFVAVVTAGSQMMVEAIDLITAALNQTEDATGAVQSAFESMTGQSILDRFDKLISKINHLIAKMKALEKAARAAAEAMKEATSGGGGGGGPAPTPLQRGLSYVPRTMTARLHRGEAVLAAPAAAAYRAASTGGMIILAPIFLDARDVVDVTGELNYEAIGARLRELQGAM